MAAWSFVHGSLFGLLPVGWTIFSAMLLYNITVETGQFTIIRRTVAGISGDARIQAILIGFSFGAFLEGAAGGGTPVAICGAIMVGLGFNPFLAAVLCLIANTSPVAYGGLGTPLIVLNGVTGIPDGDAQHHGRASAAVPVAHRAAVDGAVHVLLEADVSRSGRRCRRRRLLRHLPVLLRHHARLGPGPSLYPMTDIGGGIFSLVVTAIFLKFWKPKNEWRFDSRRLPRTGKHA